MNTDIIRLPTLRLRNRRASFPRDHSAPFSSTVSTNTLRPLVQSAQICRTGFGTKHMSMSGVLLTIYLYAYFLHISGCVHNIGCLLASTYDRSRARKGFLVSFMSVSRICFQMRERAVRRRNSGCAESFQNI